MSAISVVFGGHRVCWASLAPVGHGGEVAVEYWWRHDPPGPVWRDGGHNLVESEVGSEEAGLDTGAEEEWETTVAT